MNTRRWFLGVVLLVAVSVLAMAASGNDEGAPASFDLEEITCWDVMTSAEEERNVFLFLLYGYVAGENEQKVHTGQEIETLLRTVGEYCAQNPDTIALDAMRKGGNRP